MTDRTSGASRFYKSAVATSALPFLALGSTAAASPAVADTPSTDLSPRPVTAANMAAVEQRLQSTLGATDHAAVALPARFTQQNFQAARTAPKTYTVKAGDTLGHIALRNNVSLSNLLKWNNLKSSSTIYPGDELKLGATSSSSKSSSSSSSSSGGSYTVKAGDTLSAIAARQGMGLSTLLRANGLSMSSVIYPGQKLKLSGSSSSSSSSTRSSSSSSSNSSSSTYTVRSGDTLSGIAAKQGISLSTLLRANGLSMSSIIFPGQKLKLSGNATSSSGSSSSSSGNSSSSNSASSGTYTVKAGDTLSGIAARNSIGLSTLLRANGLSTSSIIYPGQKIKLSGSASSNNSGSSSSSGSSSGSTKASTYTVKRGDTLSGIASRNGISLQALLSANGLRSTSIIYPGQTLKLSGSSTVSTASSGNSGQLIGNTFLHYTYPDHVVANANQNKQTLLNSPMPSRSKVREMVRSTAVSMGVDPRLALAHAQIESGFDPTAVSPANAIGTMQVIPSTGEWASQLVGRKLNLLDPQDNITAGVAIIRHLQGRNPGDIGIAGYYQGEAGVRKYGMYSDTKDYVAKVKSAMSRF